MYKRQIGYNASQQNGGLGFMYMGGATILYEMGLMVGATAVSYTHLRAHETVLDLVCRLLLEKKKNHKTHTQFHTAYKNA